MEAVKSNDDDSNYLCFFSVEFQAQEKRAKNVV